MNKLLAASLLLMASSAFGYQAEFEKRNEELFKPYDSPTVEVYIEPQEPFRELDSASQLQKDLRDDNARAEEHIQELEEQDLERRLLVNQEDK